MQSHTAGFDSATPAVTTPAEASTDRAPWPQAARIITGISLLAWCAAIATILPILR